MLFKIPARQPAGTSFSAYWENFLTPDDIKRLLELPEWNNLAPATTGIAGANAINREIRISQVSWLFPNDTNNDLWHKIVDAASQVNRSFFHFDLDGCYEAAQLTMYEAFDNGNYNWHVDYMPGTNQSPRKLSMSLLLNDTSEFDGGTFEVKTNSDTSEVLEQKTGRAWFFPSWTLHRITPITRGTRKSLVIWFGGPSFK